MRLYNRPAIGRLIGLMSLPASPFMTRVRRRLAATTWLLALLVVAKVALASACPMDAGNAAAMVSLGSAIAADVSAASEIAAPSLDEQGGDWGLHGSTGDCHCACAHASPLSMANYTVDARPIAAHDFPPLAHAPLLALREDQLRPPIA